MARTERLVASGLALAALTIVALAVLVMVELDRESKLHHDVIIQLEVSDKLEALRSDLQGLAHAARIGALTGTGASAALIASRSAEIESKLATIAGHPDQAQRVAALETLTRLTRLLVLNARSIPRLHASRGREAAEAAALESERMASDASLALDRMLDTQAARINRRSLDQIRVGESLRRYVAWSIAGAMALLAALFALYRGAKRREKEALRRIEHLAHHDTVTGLPNRALLNDRMEQEMARARRNERGFALLLFDLDGFKGVNDTLGHAAGDHALVQVAERVRGYMRASDTIGRLGGDEFLAILPETELEGALMVAEKLRDALQQAYRLGDSQATLSASFGVSLFPEHAQDCETLLRAADIALYQAKREGKNRVVVSRLRAQAATPRETLAAPG